MRTPLRLFLCLFLTGIHISLYSQAGESSPADRVNIKGTYTLKKIFDLIYRQTKQQVTYANTLLDDRERVTVDVSGTIDEALTVILAGKAITWVYSEGYVALRRKSVPTLVKTSPLEDRLVTISGKVTDEDGKPLPGVTIMIKNSGKGTKSNSDGTFMLSDVTRNSILIISSIGFDKEEIMVGGKQLLNVSLKASVNALGEVVIAYGTTTQQANTGAVTVVKGEQIQTLPNRSFDKSLQGLVPGLQITNGTGQPGGGVSNMVQRGISTGASAFAGSSSIRNPLFVIDGVPVSQDQFQIAIGYASTPISNPLAQLNPSDIESISVLKDAAAIALYGSKASNGVILVTTKKGKAGKTVIGFRHQTDVSFLPARQDVLTQQEYLELLTETYKNTNPSLWTDVAIRKDLLKKFPYKVQGMDTSFYAAPDWIDAIYDKKATTLTNELTFSGGNEKNLYYLGLEYTNQRGIVQSTGFKRSSIRFNFDSKINSWLKVGMRSAFSYNDQNYSNATESVHGYGIANLMSPLNPIRRDDGSYILNYSWGSLSGTAQNNPVAAAEYNINQSQAYRYLSSFIGEASFLKYFSFSTTLGVDFMLAEQKEKLDPRFRQAGNRTGGSIDELSSRRSSIISTNVLRFSLPIREKHQVGLLVGQEAQVIAEKTLGGEAKGTSTTLPIYDQISSPGYTMASIQGNLAKQTLLSMFGQLNYDFKGKYFLTGSLRRDGSSRFGNRQQWGTYWSIGSGWVLTEEAFLNAPSSISFLKIRGSIGAAGNSGAVGPSTKYDILSQTTYDGNTAIVSKSIPGNPYIKWEKTFSWNAGLDARLFKNRVSLVADIYEKNTSDLIYSTILPSVTGYTSVPDNIGDMSNRGIELSMSADMIRKEKFKWRFSINWSTNKNILKKADVPLTAITGNILGNEEGRNFNSYYMKVWAGVNPNDGKPQWIDSSGKVTSDYNRAAKYFVGKPQPDGYGMITNTFSYKGLELSIYIYYQYGNMIYDETLVNLSNDGANPFTNQSRKALNYWKKPGDAAVNPRRILNNTDRSTSPSSRYLMDGDYLRLSNVLLSYSFSKRQLDKIGLHNLRLFVQGNNLAIWKKKVNGDPDNMNRGGALGAAFPIARSYSAGINFNL